MADKIGADMLVGTGELASVLGLTARRVQQLSEDGTLEKEGRGKFKLGVAVQKYISFISKGEITSSDKKIEKIKNIAEATLKESKAKVAKFEAKELEGNMHRSEDVENVLEDLIFFMRNSLNALPGRIASDVAQNSNPSECAEIIKKEVHAIMRELSGYRYDPIKFEERVRERKNWAVKSDVIPDE